MSGAVADRLAAAVALRQQSPPYPPGYAPPRPIGLLGSLGAIALGLVVAGAMLLPAYLSQHHLLAGDRLAQVSVTSVIGGAVLLGAALIGRHAWSQRRPPPPGPLVLAGPPTAEAVERAAAEAERAAAQVRWAQLAHDRYAAALAPNGWSAGDALLVTANTITAIAGLAAFALTERLLNGVEPAVPAATGLAWGVAALAGATAGAVARRRSRAVRDVRAGVRALAAGLDGQADVSRRGAADWLNAHWPAPVAEADLVTGPRHASVSATVGSHPVLIDFEPDEDAAGTLSRAPRLTVYVAHPDIGAPPTAAEFPGMAVDVRAGAGLVLHAEPAVVADLVRDPLRLTMLVPAVRRLAGSLPAPGTGD